MFDKNVLKHRHLNGVEGAIQLDHMVSLKTCYKNNIDPEIAGSIQNLRLITWQENIKKNHRNDFITSDELIKRYNISKIDNLLNPL